MANREKLLRTSGCAGLVLAGLVLMGGCSASVSISITSDASCVDGRVFIDGAFVGTLAGYDKKDAPVVGALTRGWRWTGQAVGDTVLGAGTSRGQLVTRCNFGSHKIKIVATNGRVVEGTFDALGGETGMLVSVDRGEVVSWMQS